MNKKANKKREKFLLWIDQYEVFKAIAIKRGISVSELLKEAIDKVYYPVDFPKKARNLTIDQQTNEKIETILNNWFDGPKATSIANRSDLINFVIGQYLHDKSD